MLNNFFSKLKAVFWGRNEVEFESTRGRKRGKLGPRGYLTEEQFNQLYDFTYDYFDLLPYYERRMQLALRILLATGCRVSELLGIRMETLIEHLHAAKPFIQINVSKTNSVRIVSLTPSEVEDLLALIKALGFKKGFAISKKDYHLKRLHRIYWITIINDFIKAYMKEYNLLHLNLRSHSFRITNVTYIAEFHGLEAASKFIGHKDILVTKRYVRRLPEEEVSRYTIPFRFRDKRR